MGIPNNLMPFVAQVRARAQHYIHTHMNVSLFISVSLSTHIHRCLSISIQPPTPTFHHPTTNPKVCVGRRDCLSVFGSDYPTPDGTGVRDYIHVVDLAEGHVAAVNRMMEAREKGENVGCVPVNLGTGQGVSVLELVKAMEQATGKAIPTKMAERRPGDVAALYTDPAFAHRFLRWRATRGVKEMCEDTWRWQSRNPWGFRPAPHGAAGGSGGRVSGSGGGAPAASASSA
jgi:hypothetical protein